MKNNLFHYASKELSQDAFICWLMSYATADSKIDENLRACAVDFIKEFVPELRETKSNDIIVKDIKHQYYHIDVLLKINDKYIIIIEDKTNTDEHDNQLVKYEKEILKRKFEHEIVKKVYYKTGFQSDYSGVESAGYHIVDRARIVEILSHHVKNSTNQILKDYYEYYNELHNNSNKFCNIQIDKWERPQILGFFNDLKQSGFFTKKGFDCNFGYVQNPNGGFHAMWIYNDTIKNYPMTKQQYELYLQLEYKNYELKICIRTIIKKGTDDKSNISPKQIREYLTYSSDSNNHYSLEKYGFNKPRFGNGNSMTIGIYSSKHNTYEDAIDSIDKAIDSFNLFCSSLI